MMENEEKDLAPQEATPETETTTAQEEKVSEETAEAAPKVAKPEPEPETPHDEFDWSIGNRHTLNYTEKEIEKYISEYEKSLSSIKENSLVMAKVNSIHDGDVVLDVNYKSDGLVSLSEFRDTPDLAPGDTVKVYVENKEDDRGQLILSRRKAKLLQAWEDIKDSYENGTIIKGTVVSKTKGGLIADCNGLETFLPGSQIDIKQIIDYDQYVGKTMEFKVVKINEAIKNAVVSHKALIESDLAEQREAIIGGLEKGQVLEGVVKNITDFGAFMDLGGVDGLLYITDISWGRINHPSEVLELNQKVNIVVLDFDEGKKRISLGLKQLTPHPWETLDAEIKEGGTVKGKVVNIEDYGAFLEIIPGVEGLVHVSEVSWSNQPVNARQFFKLGETYDAKIVTLDTEDRKMSLSIKQLENDPWTNVEALFPLNSVHKGEVKNLTPYGVFVELNDGIGGMVHISDLSWTKRYGHPSEFTKVGEVIDVTILELDLDNRKLSLGHKQLEENPWDTFENVFPVGSYHEATIVKKDDRGAIVQLPYGLEAYAPIKHTKKEDGTYAQAEEVLTFKVIEFNRDDKRIIVSHTNYVYDIKREADASVKAEKQEERVQTAKAVKKTQSKVERTTLGDLDVFSQLKQELAGSTPPPPPPAPKKEEVKEEAVEAPLEEAPANAAPEDKAEAVEAEKPKAVKADKPDDLKKIEGIGPKIAELLTNNGIPTFAALAASEVATVKGILSEAGSRYSMHDPTSWPIQAKMAADGQWDELKKWQDEHDGGKM
jgi:small subunit ribosomal protein S1